MKAAELFKRYLVLCAGLLIMAFGVACSIRADLGTSPISSLPYVLSLITPLSVGVVTILMHCVFILLQILLLRRRYQLIQLMQLPVALVFGALTDAALGVLSNVSCSAYWQQWVLCVLGILLVGLGVSCEVTAGVVTVAGEGLVLAITRVFPIRFSTMKISFDVLLVIVSCVLSLVFLGGIHGVREGTLAAALLVGTTAKVLRRPMDAFASRWLCAERITA